MGYDLLLTNSGDLSFIVSSSKFKNEKLEFNFHVAPSDSLLFNFAVDNANNLKDITFPNKYTVASRIDQIIQSINEINNITDAVVGMRVYIKDENKTHVVSRVSETEHKNEFGETIKITKVDELEPIDFSPSFDFNFYAYELQHDKINRVVTDKSYIQQAIKIRLNSESNSIRENGAIGADLYQFVHSNTTAPKLLGAISERVKIAIADILPNCTVEAYIINSDYLNYHDSIKIVITNNEDVYYYYV